jgi:hypothetical protein
MALLEGQSLDDRLLPGRPLPLAETLRIGREVAAGLAAAHQRGLVHRDVKPANIWLESGGGRVKLLDFGLARSIDSDTRLTRLGAVVGTPAFMSPEQARGETLDPRADLFSLGCVLYLLSTGEPPFVGLDHAAVMAAVERDQPLAPRKLRPELPEAFSELVMRLLAKARDERPQSALEVIERIREIEQSPAGAAHAHVSGGAPLSKTFASKAAKPAPIRVRDARPALRRSPMFISTAAAVLLLLLVGGYYAATVIIAEWTNGKLIIETDDKNVEVVVKHEGDKPLVEIVERGTRRTFYLRPGEYGIKVTVKDGDAKTSFFTRELTLERAGREVLNVRLELAKAARPVEPPVEAKVADEGRATDVLLPLEEWLKGRELLTVGKAPRGSYHTIGEALAAAKPGQVVCVVDAGPYHERLDQSLPEGVGLVSMAGAVVEMPAWKKWPFNPRGGERAHYMGHLLESPGGLRLSGLTFVCPSYPADADYAMSVCLHCAGAVTVDGCRVLQTPGMSPTPSTGPDEEREIFSVAFFEPYTKGGAALRPAQLRVEENRLEGVLSCSFGCDSMSIRRNLVIGSGWECVRLPPRAGRLEVAHNVLFGFRGILVVENSEACVIANNVIDALVPLQFNFEEGGKDGQHLELPKLRLANNAIRSRQSGGIHLTEQDLESVREAWRVDHNCYLAQPQPINELVAYPSSDSDLIERRQFLSIDWREGDFLRIAADGPLAKSGAGGDLPEYIGALPPGPAPKKGDWLTRLLDSARDSAASGAISPVAIPEPPPLAEWLKGREIITVAQDGSGDYRTIQQALNALKAGQVVRVLDKGPYRERLVATLPRDVGLVSEVGTRIEFDKWHQAAPFEKPGTFIYQGCALLGTDGLRLAGIELACPELEPDAGFTSGLIVEAGGDVVVEACRILDAAPEGMRHSERLHRTQSDRFRGIDLFTGAQRAHPEARFHFENNYLEGVASLLGEPRAITLRHNLMVRSGMALYAWPTEFDCRENIVFGHTGIWFPVGAGVKDAKREGAYRITNNLFETEHSIIWTWPSAPEATVPKGVRIANNLFRSANQKGLDFSDAGLRASAAASWAVDHNSYHSELLPAEGLFSLPPKLDRVSDSQFISEDFTSDDFLRIHQDNPLSTAGAGGDFPDYVGAFPPGSAPGSGDWFKPLLEAARDSAAASQAKPIEIPELPPLAEWLKGRDVITVAQDGSGDFRTITYAAREVKSGQVIRIVDKGPYRERLNVRLPSDVGIVSEVGTRIEIPKWEPHGFYEGGYEGWRLTAGGKLRLHGLEFHFPDVPAEAADAYGLHIEEVSETLTIDACRMLLPFGYEPSDERSVRPYPFFGILVKQPPGCTTTIAENRIDGGLYVYSQSAEAVSILRNHIVARGGYGMSLLGPAKRVVVNHNVVSHCQNAAYITSLYSKGDGPQASVWLANNLLSSTHCAFLLSRPDEPGWQMSRDVLVQNNLFDGPPAGIYLKPDDFALAQDAWRVDFNAYRVKPGPGDATLSAFPLQPHDRLSEGPLFVSDRPAHSDYFRIPADSPLAAAGAGGALPAYIGAFPPGPAPREGDWFTRLNQPRVDEPLPLAQWLAGRTTLTVAQDGSGDYKTIQEALKNLKAGQVVKILDRGPYVERFELDLPEDVGIVSDAGARIEIPAWTRQNATHWDATKFFYIGAVLRCPRGLRLAGLEFAAPEVEPDTHFARPLDIFAAGDVVVENCRFVYPGERGVGRPRGDDPIGSLFIFGNHHETAPARFFFWENYLEGEIESHGEIPVYVFERNYIRCGKWHALLLRHKFRTLRLRHNVIVAGGIGGVSLEQQPLPASDAEETSIEIASNTFDCETVPLTILPPIGGGATIGEVARVQIQNNVLLSRTDRGIEVHAAVGSGPQRRNWRLSHNAYAAMPKLAAGWMSAQSVDDTDIVEPALLLSDDPSHSQFARIAADGPLAKGGAGGDLPAYLGALPPGPAPEQGDWFSRLIGGARDSAARAAHQVAIGEPLLLAEWLKGRDIITVAQDGSGDFKSIQEALDRLGPGQAVKVLDAGPYREQIKIASAPVDTGLVSEVGTRIQIPQWHHHDDVNGKPRYDGMGIFAPSGFRLSGFEILCPELPKEEEFDSAWAVGFDGAGEITVENCRILRSPRYAVDFDSPADRDFPRFGQWFALLLSKDVAAENEPARFTVRDSFLEGILCFPRACPCDAVVLRNFIVERRGYVVILPQRPKSIVVAGNVLQGVAGVVLLRRREQEGEAANPLFLIANNTINTSHEAINMHCLERMDETDALPVLNVRVHNNIFRSQRGEGIIMAEQDFAAVSKAWDVGHNCHVPSPTESLPGHRLLPVQPTDLKRAPEFLSEDPRHGDYLRISAERPLATAGAGGELPSYIGALPPGPAPLAGDWFTRRRERGAP